MLFRNSSSAEIFQQWELGYEDSLKNVGDTHNQTWGNIAPIKKDKSVENGSF